MTPYYQDPYEPEEPRWEAHEPLTGGGWLEGLQNLWQWDDIAAEIGQEIRARVAFIGLPGAGKSVLFNQLRGWELSAEPLPAESNEDLQVEPFGFFVLADLPAEATTELGSGEQLLCALGEPALVVYLLDGAAGVRPADYRWLAALRACSVPLVIALNKIDLLQDLAATTGEAEQRLGMPVIPIAARGNQYVNEKLVPAILDAAPRLAVPLGRELAHLRRVAARRVIQQVALFAGLMGAQPIPLLDIPFQAMLQVGMVMRVGAAFGRTPTGGINREIISTVVSSLGLRYLAASLIKLVPVLGWIVGGMISMASTLLIGEIAIRYFEARGQLTMPQIAQRFRWKPLRLRRRNDDEAI